MADPPRVLIATHYFAPKNEIASVRLTNFAMGLTVLGWDVDVVTVDANPFNPLERRMDLGISGPELDAVRVVSSPTPYIARGMYAGRRRRAGTTRADVRGSTPPVNGVGSVRSAATSAASRRLVTAAAALRDRAYVHAMSRASGLRSGYDVVWASYGPRYVIDAGIALADRFPEAAFIADVRDPVVRRSAFSRRQDRAVEERLEDRLLRRADAVTAASNGLLLHPEKLDGRVYVVTNGFDIDAGPAADELACPGSTGAISLYYGGRVYPEQQFDALVLACREVASRRAVEVHYAGTDEDVFRAAFAAHGAENLVRSHGTVSRDESLRLAKAVTCDLVFSWNTAERGVLTGKVFELISLNRPIVTIVAGDHRTSALADLFAGDPYRRVFGNETDAGSVAEIATFIEQMADQNVVPDEFDGGTRYADYTYPQLVKRLDGIFREAVERRRSRA